MNAEKTLNQDSEEKLHQEEILKRYASEIRERWTSDHSGLAEAMFRKAGESKATVEKVRKAGAEGARALFIALIIEKYGFNYISDILLADMGLLDGYQKESGVMERRKQYFIESNYRSEDNPDGKDNKDVDAAILDDRAANLNKVDVPLFKKLVLYFDEIQDKDDFFEMACSKYLDVPKNSNGVVRVRYPVPHYKVRFENPIKHLPFAENESFCGREDILAELDEGFQARYERSIQMLYGMGGVGKTEIALKYAYDHIDQYSTIVWLDAASIQKLEDSVRHFLSQYSSKGVEGLTDTESVAIAFCRFINQRVSSLIVLDNADYIDKNSETGESEFKRLSWFIPKKNAHTLITTRCDMNVRGISRIAVDVFRQEVALDFLSEKTGKEADNFAEELARKLGYLPLALEYAGAYILTQDISYKDYIEKWKRVGAGIFDRDYAAITVREAFHISLEKIRIPFAIEFLQFLSEHGPSIHFDSFFTRLDADGRRIREQLDQGRKVLFFQFGPEYEQYTYHVINFFYDGSVEVESSDEPNLPKRIPQNPLITALRDEMSLDEIIRILKNFSLINWGEGTARAHPLLLEIVNDDACREGVIPVSRRTPNEWHVLY